MRAGTVRRVLGAVAGVVMVGAILVVPSAATAAAPKQCRVKNKTQDTWFATDSGLALTNALEQAQSGDRLNVFGRCRGSFSIDVDISLYGNTNRQDPTILDGAGEDRPVLGVPSWATVSLHRLTITGGDTTPYAGGGITNGGSVTLHHSKVVGNRSGVDGGGIFNWGDLTLHHTLVAYNNAGGGGGGIFNEGMATLNDSWVVHNVASGAGGISNANTLELNNTVVAQNTPDDCPEC